MKHTNTILQQYCRAVRKKLPLPARQRRQLLAGLQEELAESAPDCATLDALIAQFGTPDETAQELLSSISPEQLQTYQKQYRRRCILAAALAILLRAGLLPEDDTVIHCLRDRAHHDPADHRPVRDRPGARDVRTRTGARTRRRRQTASAPDPDAAAADPV